MRIAVVGRHFDVTEPIKKYVDGKLLKLDRYAKNIKEANAILEVQKFRHIAELTLSLKQAKLTATEESEDMYVSIDKAVDSLHKQLLKFRERAKEHKARKISPKTLFGFLFQGRSGKAYDKDKRPNVITRRFQSKPMSIEEASLELDLFKDDFLVFRNSETDMINVIYKREDGDYGLIVPE